jgi:predicted nucleic acid-binding protein
LIYLDASFVVSLYSVDANSRTALSSLPSSGEFLTVTKLAELETVNALELRVFRQAISRAEADASLRTFDEDLRKGVFLRTGIPESAYERARKLSLLITARVGVRTIDLLHVAAALELGATDFFTFDVRQQSVAADAGLKLNPMP